MAIGGRVLTMRLDVKVLCVRCKRAPDLFKFATAVKNGTAVFQCDPCGQVSKLSDWLAPVAGQTGIETATTFE